MKTYTSSLVVPSVSCPRPMVATPGIVKTDNARGWNKGPASSKGLVKSTSYEFQSALHPPTPHPPTLSFYVAPSLHIFLVIQPPNDPLQPNGPEHSVHPLLLFALKPLAPREPNYRVTTLPVPLWKSRLMIY